MGCVFFWDYRLLITTLTRSATLSMSMKFIKHVKYQYNTIYLFSTVSVSTIAIFGIIP